MLPPAQLPRDLRIKADVDYAALSQAFDALANEQRLRLLAYLTSPHYLEEIASELKMSRQAAHKHLDRLMDAGILEKQAGERSSGPVTEYVLNERALFLIHDEFGKLGVLRRRGEAELLARTLVGSEGADRQALRGPCLNVVHGFGAGRRFPLGPTERRWVLGRHPKCDFVLNHDPYASAKHAEVRRDGATWVLADLGSTNGVQHNFARMAPRSVAALHHGDLVEVGKTLLLFWENGPDAAGEKR